MSDGQDISSAAARKRVVFICNALDDVTRAERNITGDSPAASRKVFLASQSIRLAGVRPVVLSWGRGRPDNSGNYFKAVVRRVSGVPVIYAPFSHNRPLSLLLALIAPTWLMWRVARLRGPKTAVFYNRSPLHILALVMATLLRWRRVLALEDGEVGPWHNLGNTALRLTRFAFDRLCNGGALLACSNLEHMTKSRPVQCFYGTAEILPISHDWEKRPLTVLMCGSIWPETGALVLAEAIKRIRERDLTWANAFELVLTGTGECMPIFAGLEKAQQAPCVRVLGRTSADEYRAVLAQSHVGLALKLVEGELADTTFPSKVVEFASAGLLVLTTAINDVPKVMGDGAIYLESDDPELLIARLEWIVSNPVKARAVTAAGKATMIEKFSPPQAGRNLERFLFPG